MIPVSTYGAQKLASEALIASYCFMFGFTGLILRFANVVGPKQTHGVAYDFLRKLLLNPSELNILGDGSQKKPYIHVDDVIECFLMMDNLTSGAVNGFEYYNVASNDFLTVNEIADLACEKLGAVGTNYIYSGGTRGWKADVPHYSLDTTKLRNQGWNVKRNSSQAVGAAMESMIEDIKLGLIPAW